VTILAGNTADHNTFAGPGGTPAGLGVTAADFISTAIPVVSWDSFHPAGTGGDRSGTTTPAYATGAAVGPRQADGSLPVIDFLKLAPGSHLIDAGVNVGLPYNGAAPDLGWFESGTAGPALPGDYNNDGVVNAGDYSLWRMALNTSAVLPNDATPGTVDDTDFDVWRAHFGQTSGGGALFGSATAVPEPAAVFLAALATIAVALPRRGYAALS